MLSRIWTRVAASISYDDNHYTTGTWLPFIGQIELFINLQRIIIIRYLKLYSRVQVIHIAEDT